MLPHRHIEKLGSSWRNEYIFPHQGKGFFNALIIGKNRLNILENFSFKLREFLEIYWQRGTWPKGLMKVLIFLIVFFCIFSSF